MAMLSFDPTAPMFASANHPPPSERIVIRDGKVTRRPALSVVAPPLRRGMLGPGTVLAGRYELTRLLGEGATGEVWEAIHTFLQRRVALKVLKSSEPATQRRFFREARVTAALRHPYIVAAHDVFVVPGTGTPVIVMEALDGAPLSRWIRRPDGRSCALPHHQAMRILLPVVAAVRTAHAAGIVHRDLKPENIFLVGREPSLDAPHVKVLDFGIAKVVNAGNPLDSDPITRGSMLGTPHYMSPEQVSGDHPISAATDVWALGVVLYELLAGARPVDGRNLTQIFRAILESAVVPLGNVAPTVPTRIADLVTRMLSRVPTARPSLDEVYTTLAAHAGG